MKPYTLSLIVDSLLRLYLKGSIAAFQDVLDAPDLDTDDAEKIKSFLDNLEQVGVYYNETLPSLGLPADLEAVLISYESTIEPSYQAVLVALLNHYKILHAKNKLKK